jgi:serine-type D-Ala-D-Ala carboxypeptidase/endopeptidase
MNPSAPAPASAPEHQHADRERRILLKLAPAGAAVALGWTGAARALDARETGPTDALLRARIQDRGVGLVAVHVQGEQVDLNVQGRARVDAPEALRGDALFEIGSITKTFTALLLADAVVRRQLALTDPVEAALPDGSTLRDAAGAPIRWVDLATQRSGLPRLPGNLRPSMPSDPYNDYGEPQLLAFLRDFVPSVERGARCEYSNLGFGLMGYALGRALGSDYPRALASRVLQPLGLTDAYLALPGRNFDRLAGGHDAERLPMAHWHFDMLAGAGALVMTGAMLARYAQAALGVRDTPLREAFALARGEHAPGQSEKTSLGLAWMRVSLNGRTLLNHDGGTFGFSSSLWLDPSRRRAAAVLSNAAVELDDLTLHLLDASLPLRDFKPLRLAEIAQTAEQLAPLVGVYAFTPQFKLTVSLRGDALWAQATAQAPFALFASALRRFFAKITPLEITFDAGEPAPALTLTQGGQTLRGTREPTTRP